MWSEKTADVLRFSRRDIYEVTYSKNHDRPLFTSSPVAAPPASADQDAITAHIEIVAAADEAAAASATAAAASEAVVLK